LNDENPRFHLRKGRLPACQGSKKTEFRITGAEVGLGRTGEHCEALMERGIRP